MSRSKDKVISDMRKIAICKADNTNLRHILALASSLDFLQTCFSSNICHDFIQIICRPNNFNLAYEQLSNICYYNEKSIRLHCKQYAKTFLNEYERLKHLSLPIVIAHLIEYKLTPSLNNNIPSLRALKYADIAEIITTFQCSGEEKNISLILCNYFYENTSEVAI